MSTNMLVIRNYLILILLFFNCCLLPREVKTCSIYRHDSRPQSELYLVQPSPVQFIKEPQDLVFFHGDTISLHCETDCVQLEQRNTTCAVGFLYSGFSLDYAAPFELVLSDFREIGRRTLTIHNAKRIVSGRYQCHTYSTRTGYLPLTDRVIGRPIQLQMAALEPIGEEVQRVNVSEGGSLELPCMRGVFPNPSKIRWWKDEDQCDSVQCLGNAEILSNGNLVLTNVTADMSGDHFHCKIGWKNHKSYKATYQIFLDSYSAKKDMKIVKSSPLPEWSPSVVALNASIDHVSGGSAIYYKSDLLVDLQNVDDYLINVTITCTFSGHPRPQVKWFLNGLNVSECIDTTNIVTEGNKSVLYITTTNSKSFFGSYQCVVDNEVGYASKTTRILPKGWSNPPRRFSAAFQNTNITLRWQPPDYTGGEMVQYYRVGFRNLYERHGRTSYLENRTSLHSYAFGDIRRFTVNGEFYVQFTVEAMNANAIPISDVSSIRLDSYPNDIYPEIDDVECRGRNVVVKWTNHNQTVYNNIWDNCVFFNCSTPGGTVTGETCVPVLRRSHHKLQHQLRMNNVPLSGICAFRVLVFTDGYIYRWSNDDKTCLRNLSSEVTSKIMDEAPIKRDRVTLTCQATSDPFPTISWRFNDSSVNESDKYQISTNLLNYTTSTSALTVNSVESSDVGRYACYATNGLSTDVSYGVISVNENQKLMQKKKRKVQRNTIQILN